MSKTLSLVASFLLISNALATPVEWAFPRDSDCHEGIPFADGKTGVLVWGGGDTVNLTVGRGDLWDHRGGYAWLPEQNYTNIIAAVATRDEERLKSLFRNEVPENWGGRYNPYMLPLGRVTVRIPGAELTSGELDPKTGLGKLTAVLDGRSVDIELAMSKKVGRFGLRLPVGTKYEVKAISAIEFPTVSRILRPRGFGDAEKWADDERGGFLWQLPADPSVSLAWTRRGNELEVATERGRKASPEPVGFDEIRAGSMAHWKNFWNRSAKISVPDALIQRVFDYGMYRFGAMTDPDGFAAGLQGQWLEDDRLVPWNGDYHFNINVQECYSPAYRGGHFEHLKPLFAMIKTWWPLLRDNARKFCGIEDGFVLPHSVDDRGVCIGGFWAGTIDHASTAWVAEMMFKYVRYSGDREFLKTDAYPFMKGAMNVFRAMMEERDGKLSLPLGPSPEWGAADVRKCVGRDPSFQLASAHRLVRDLIAAADMLGETADPMWKDVEARLPQFTPGPGGFQLFAGQPFVASHRHHSHMAGLYPFDTIDMSKFSREVTDTYRTWVGNGTGAWSGWCVPWASILNVHVGNPDAAAHLIHAWDTFYTNPGHGSCHDAQRGGFSTMMGRIVMQMDGQCAAVTAIMEMMVHEINGKAAYFRGCPAEWKRVSFENIRLSDGTSISGVRDNGKVSIIASGNAAK